MASFFRLSHPTDKRYCAIFERPDDMPKGVRPTRGRSMEGCYTGPVSFRMSPKEVGIQVPDVIRNAVGYLMVSERMRELLEKHVEGAVVEYLPFVLLNHKKRVAADPCYIVNVIGTIDCGDRANCEGPETPVCAEPFDRHVGHARRRARTPQAIVACRGDDAGDVGAVRVSFGRLDVVVVVRRIPTIDVIHVTIAIVVDAVAGYFLGVAPKIGIEILVRDVDAVVRDSDDDFGLAGFDLPSLDVRGARSRSRTRRPASGEVRNLLPLRLRC